MAAPAESAASSSSENEDDDNVEPKQADEELDFFSPKFNPLKALISPDVIVPFQNVKSFSSIDEYEVAINKSKSKSRNRDRASQSVRKLKPIYKEKPIGSAATTITNDTKGVATTSKLKVHSETYEEPVKLETEEISSVDRPGSFIPGGKAAIGRGRGRGRMGTDRPSSSEEATRSSSQPKFNKHTRNVLSRMDDMFGPLELLTRCVKERLHVRVMTRAAVTLKSIFRGYILAFDKFFNMALIDVDEIYRRPACQGKIRVRRTHKLQQAQQTLKKEREVQRERFMHGDSKTGEFTQEDSKDFTQIKELGEVKDTGFGKKSKQQGVAKHDSSQLNKNLPQSGSERKVKSVYEGVPAPFSNYEREALMLGIADENVEHRHVNQLFIRGENVVLVSIIED